MKLENVFIRKNCKQSIERVCLYFFDRVTKWILISQILCYFWFSFILAIIFNFASTVFLAASFLWNRLVTLLSDHPSNLVAQFIDKVSIDGFVCQ